MDSFSAAATQVDLRPAVGSRLTGFASRLDSSTGVHDPLMAKVLLLDDGAARLAWVACDVIGFSVSDAAEFRAVVAHRLSIAPTHVLVSCTHTHSGPSSMPFRGDLAQVDRAWLSRTFQSVSDAAAVLPSLLRPARFRHATAVVPDLGYNRQDGVSPIDERLLAVQFFADDDAAIATILNYTTHPVVLGEGNLAFSADYPGYATRAVEQAAGGVAMFVLGAAGDVDPAVYRDRGRHAGTFDVAEEMGRRLATAATTALRSADAGGDGDLRLAASVVHVPLDPPPAREELARLKAELLARRGPLDAVPSTNEARWAIFELAWIEDLERAMARDAVPRAIQAQLIAIQIGDLAIVAFPFEIYSQIGLDIRRRLAPRPVLIAGYTNGVIGYVPTELAIRQGGYGPAFSYRFFPELLTPIASGAAEALVRAATTISLGSPA